MLELGARLSARHGRRDSTPGYRGAVIQLDATMPQSAEASVWRDLKGLADFNAVNAVLNNAGTPDAYYGLSGTGYFRPDANPDILANLHKTAPGNQWTIVITGQTGTIDNDWLFGTHPSTGVSNGFGLRWTGSTDLKFHQFTDGALAFATPTKLENNKDFILIVSFDGDTNELRIWETDQTPVEATLPYNANLNDPDGIFTLGGLTNRGEFNGRLYGFMVLPTFIASLDARRIMAYYNDLHGRVYVPDPLNALFVGQSNMEKLFTDFGGAGATQFQISAGSYYPLVNTVNGAKGAAAVDYNAAGLAGAYLNSTNDGKGEVYGTHLDVAVAASGIHPDNFDVVYVLIGETDSVAVNNGTISEADHKAAYETFVGLLRDDFVNAKIISVPIMSDTNGNEFTGWGQVRRAQFEVVRDTSWLLEAPGMYDLSHEDDLHLDQIGYEGMATRLVELYAAYNGERSLSGVLGPRAISAVYDPDAEYIEVTIEHDAGSDFTISEHRGQVVDVNGALAGGTSGGVVRVDADTYRVSLPSSSLSSGDDVTYLWPWGTLRGYNINSILKDNASVSLPLRPSFDIDVSEI